MQGGFSDMLQKILIHFSVSYSMSYIITSLAQFCPYLSTYLSIYILIHVAHSFSLSYFFFYHTHKYTKHNKGKEPENYPSCMSNGGSTIQVLIDLQRDARYIDLYKRRSKHPPTLSLYIYYQEMPHSLAKL